MIGGLCDVLNALNIGGVSAASTRFAASCRRTVTVIPNISSSGGNGIVSYIRTNCLLGSGILHRTGITMKRWPRCVCVPVVDVTGQSCCSILNINGSTGTSSVGGTCHGVTVRCRPSHRANGDRARGGRTRRGFGRTTRTCSILSSRRGHGRCSRFNFRKPSVNDNFNNFNNDKSSISSVLRDIFNSSFTDVFNNDFNNGDCASRDHNNHNNGHICGNRSLHVGIGIALRRTDANIAGGLGVHGSIYYNDYRNANDTSNDNVAAYSRYNNSNTICHARRDVFNIVRSRSIYPVYRNRNRVVHGGYHSYSNDNIMENRRIVRIRVPTNINSNVVIATRNGNGTNPHGNIDNSVRVCVTRRPRDAFVHSNRSLVCGLLLSFPATTLNNSIRIPALSKGQTEVGVRPNARPNGALELEKGNLPTIGNCNDNHNSLLIGVDICIPGALATSRHRTVRCLHNDDGLGNSRRAGGAVFSRFQRCFWPPSLHLVTIIEKIFVCIYCSLQKSAQLSVPHYSNL